MKGKTKRKYDKPISFYPLKPEKVISAFMKIDPQKVLMEEKKVKK